MANEFFDGMTVGGTTYEAVDTGARQLIASLQSALDALTGGDTTTAIESFNEVIDFLEGVTDQETLVGKLNLLNTAIAAKYSKPSTGIPATDLAQAVQTTLNSVANKANSTDVYTKSQTYSKSEVDAAVAEAGKVKSVSVNDGEPAEPDENGNVNIEVEGWQGSDGVTPHIDQVTGHWFIGDTDTNVSAQGPQGNSGVASGDEVVVVNNLNGNPSDLQEGQVAALSAEMGKYLGLGILAGGGTFGDAFDKASENNVVFPWLLRDVDEDNNNITKMIWHIGNGEFVDAIGSKVNGQKNGLTVVATAPCYMRVYKAHVGNTAAGYYPRAGTVGTKDGATTVAVDYLLSVGENNFKLADIAEYNSEKDRYEVSTIIIVDDNEDENARTTVTNTITSIDFGGLTLISSSNLSSDNYTTSHPSPKGLFRGNTTLKTVKRLVVDGDLGYAFSGCTSLEDIEISGKKTFGGFSQLLTEGFSIVKLDLSGLSLLNTTELMGLVNSNSDNTTLAYADIRGLDTSAVTRFNNIFNRRKSLKTLVIGNFSTENVTNYGTCFQNVSNATLVCTTTTPPVFRQDFVNNHFTSIKVPSSAETAYKTNVLNAGDTVGTSGWSKYASIITTYEEGEY